MTVERTATTFRSGESAAHPATVPALTPPTTVIRGLDPRTHPPIAG